jgi:SAM-dependent MidA family methyltransferase
METPLGRWIREQIEGSGPAPFERFMDWALYHPVHGYYTSGRVRVGHDEGDFTTAPHLSRIFARCLTRLIEAADRALGSPRSFVLAEGGPGEGRLARDLLDALQQRAPDLYRRLSYAPDEISLELRRRQQNLLSGHGAKVLPGLPDDPFLGVYLSNEFLDAFPVHRLRRRGGKIFEIHVAVTARGLAEVLLPPSRPDLLEYLEREALDIHEGCEVEINLRVAAWVRATSRRLRRGYIVTLDYGDETARLYGPQRPRGTCVAYRGHRVVDDSLSAPGCQDLTAHVDFSALQRAGSRHGLVAAPLLCQRDFLFALGLAEEVADLERMGLSEPELIQARQAVAPLIMPGDGMGESFKALVQAKRVALEALPLDPLRGAAVART